MKKIFLLGGHDLEMVEIKKLLLRHGCEVCDANLRWDNAVLEVYSDVLEQNPDSEFVGIELRDPQNLSAKYNYTNIDHHNENIAFPASILQVASLVGESPNRRMELVAANDSGYIPAMKAMGASDAEIALIRQEDRFAQGVTAEDEFLAEQSVKNHICQVGNTVTVRALTPCFSAISDRLYPYRSLLIYSTEAWVFYGEGKSDILARSHREIDNGLIYHGGGANGYIGAAKGAFSYQKILEFVSSFNQ